MIFISASQYLDADNEELDLLLSDPEDFGAPLLELGDEIEDEELLLPQRSLRGGLGGKWKLRAGKRGGEASGFWKLRAGIS